ncbi:hypothetical protein GH721_14150 [Kriegella sp. EG-1]|nr:hypothetical protein [Flavobacteriaceae bacterium EG-1]
MKTINYIGIFIILLVSFKVFSQERSWTIEKSKDGKSTVKHDLVKEDKRTHFYYIAQTTANVTLGELDSYFSKTMHHQNFLERTPITEEIEKIAGDEWLAYYFFDAPWPLANSDVVLRIKRTKENRKLIFTATAIAHNYKKSNVERMTRYNVIYEFESLDDQTTKITYNADYVPVGSIPKFLIKAWFPEGPANIVTNLGALKLK